MQAILELVEKICPEWIGRPSPDFSNLEKVNHIMKQVMPGHIGMQIDHVSKEEVRGSIALHRQKTANLLGNLHGGATFTLGDTLAGVLLWLKSDGSYFGVTKSSLITYRRPVKKGTLYCSVSETFRDDKTVEITAKFTDEKNHSVCGMIIQFSLHKFK